MKIQSDGHIKAQTGETHKTKACFFFDFSDLVSIAKGIKSMWKHVKTKPATTRWGIYVQKEPFEAQKVKLQSVWGACFVRASFENVPSKHFDYFVMPPHLPYHAFKVGQFWGSPATQWAAFSNHKAEQRAARTERKHYLELNLNPFDNIRAGVLLPAVSANGGRMRPRRAAMVNPEYKKAVGQIKKAWSIIFDLEGEYDAAVSTLNNFEGAIGQFSRDVEMLKGHNEKGIGAGQRHMDTWLMAPPLPEDGMPTASGLMTRAKLRDRRHCGLDAPRKFTCVYTFLISHTYICTISLHTPLSQKHGRKVVSPYNHGACAKVDGSFRKGAATETN
jgi:hypothetical protein